MPLQYGRRRRHGDTLRTRAIRPEGPNCEHGERHSDRSTASGARCRDRDSARRTAGIRRMRPAGSGGFPKRPSHRTRTAFLSVIAERRRSSAQSDGLAPLGFELQRLARPADATGVLRCRSRAFSHVPTATHRQDVGERSRPGRGHSRLGGRSLHVAATRRRTASLGCGAQWLSQRHVEPACRCELGLGTETEDRALVRAST